MSEGDRVTDERTEWLETDGLGGYASGTTAGIRTRRYHALLATAGRPPLCRYVLVSGFDAFVGTPAGAFAISSQRYTPETVYPDGVTHVVRFEDDPWPTWTFRLHDGTTVVQELFMARGAPLVAVAWRVEGPAEGVTLTLRPFLSGREHHSLHHENPGFLFEEARRTRGVVWRPYAGVPGIVSLTNGTWMPRPLWYRNFLYEEERARGLDSVEDLASPGTLHWDLSKGEAVWILAAERAESEELLRDEPAEAVWKRLHASERRRRRAFASRLYRSADAYLVRRGDWKTVIAGYPWFTDWGRDAFVALRGLYLATGRLRDARDVLVEWAHYLSDGMLPNCFPGGGGDPEYNSVDSALWFVIAAGELLEKAAGSTRVVTKSDRALLQETALDILRAYSHGTRFGIAADAEGLLRAGEPGVRVTWTDAVANGQVVTPRTGKAVEVQALWLNALRIGGEREARFRQDFERGLASFRQRFWNEAGGFLHDVVDVNHEPGRLDSTFRANQILAVGGLPLNLLEREPARRLVQSVEERLWTPLGLRTLAPGEPGYTPRYEGGVRERDRACHQGIVWPWLLGPFVEAWVRVRAGTAKAKREARERFLEPLHRHLLTAGLGHVSELADAEEPFTPRGCPFQAWSLGELLRLELDVLKEEAPRRKDEG